MSSHRRPQLSAASLAAALLAAVLLAAGCSTPQAPDAALIDELRPAVEATVAAMALPAAEQPSARDLDAQLQMLSCRVTPAHAAAIRAGTHGRAALLADWRDLLGRRATLQRTQQPPRLLAWLVAHEPWSTGQALLAEALLRQYENEAGLDAPDPVLAR
jgi:hypothetical protein